MRKKVDRESVSGLVPMEFARRLLASLSTCALSIKAAYERRAKAYKIDVTVPQSSIQGPPPGIIQATHLPVSTHEFRPHPLEPADSHLGPGPSSLNHRALGA